MGGFSWRWLSVLGVAAAVVLSVTAGQLGPHWLQSPGLRSTQLAQEINGALDKAEAAAREIGRLELDSWHAKLMERVDQRFLEQHLSFTSKWMTVARYWWTSATVSADKAFTEQLEAQERLFKETVLSEDELRASLTAIGQTMAVAFADALDARLTDVAHQKGVTDAEIEAQLSGIEGAPMAVSTTSALDEARRIQRRFRAVKGVLSVAHRVIPMAIDVTSAPVNWAWVHSASKEAAAAGSKGALKAAAHKAALAGAKTAGAKATAATAVKAGGVFVGGPFAIIAIAGVAAWEWWDHTKSVAEQKPILLEQINEWLAAYETALLVPDGQLGSILTQMKDALRRRAVQ